MTEKDDDERIAMLILAGQYRKGVLTKKVIQEVCKDNSWNVEFQEEDILITKNSGEFP